MNVERFPVVGFIPRLKPMGFRLATAVTRSASNLYKLSDEGFEYLAAELRERVD